MGSPIGNVLGVISSWAHVGATGATRRTATETASVTWPVKSMRPGAAGTRVPAGTLVGLKGVTLTESGGPGLIVMQGSVAGAVKLVIPASMESTARIQR